MEKTVYEEYTRNKFIIVAHYLTIVKYITKLVHSKKYASSSYNVNAGKLRSS